MPFWLQVASLAIAIWGAALSTVTLVFRFKDRRAQRTKLLIKKEVFEISDLHRGGATKSTKKFDRIRLELINMSMPARAVYPSHVSAIVSPRTSWFARLRSTMIDFGHPTPRPADRAAYIGGGDYAHYAVPSEPLLIWAAKANPGSSRMQFVVRDETRNMHRGQPLDIDAADLAQYVAKDPTD